MTGTFDFCPGTHTWKETPPDEPSAVSFRGWVATTKPAVPYCPKFTLRLQGMRWYLTGAGNALDVTTNPMWNVGRLRAFYIQHRLWDTFTYKHEVFGLGLYKFAEKVVIPDAIPNSGGLLEGFEIVIMPSNPSFS